MGGRLAILALLLATACGGDDKTGSAPAAAPPPAAAVTSSDPRAQLFITKGCPQCHSISAFGVKSPAEVGPDLTNAYDDVETRFGVELEDFLKQPTGTMQMVLSSMITLTPAERDSVIHLLKQLHEAREERAEGDHR